MPFVAEPMSMPQAAVAESRLNASAVSSTIEVAAVVEASKVRVRLDGSFSTASYLATAASAIITLAVAKVGPMVVCASHTRVLLLLHQTYHRDPPHRHSSTPHCHTTCPRPRFRPHHHSRSSLADRGQPVGSCPEPPSPKGTGVGARLPDHSAPAFASSRGS